MISRVTLSNFKSFSREEEIVLSQPTDDYWFDVIVGKNGSGKSCLVEAIEWCLCNISPRNIRASGLKDLINIDSRDGNMKVSIELLRDAHVSKKTCEKLMITRTYNGKVNKLKCDLIRNGNIEKIAPSEVPDLLHEFGVSTSRMSSIRIKQNQTQIACRAPLDLLNFIETVCGSIEQKNRIDLNNATMSEVYPQIAMIEDSLAELNDEVTSLNPAVENVKRCLSEALQMNFRRVKATSWKVSLLTEKAHELQNEIDQTQIVVSTLLEERDRKKHDLDVALVARDAAARQVILNGETLKYAREIFHTVKKNIGCLERKNIEKYRQLDERNRSLSETRRKMTKLERKMEINNFEIQKLKTSVVESELLVRSFDDMINEDVLIPKCAAMCESFVDAVNAVANVSSSIDRNEKQLLKVYVYKNKSEEISSANKVTANRIKIMEADIIRDSQRKIALNAEMAECQLRLHKVQALEKKKIALHLELESQLENMSELQELEGVTSKLDTAVDNMKAMNSSVVGMLLSLAKPVSDDYSAALMSVLGGNAFNTVVVENRECAIFVADKLMKQNIIFSSIVISAEICSQRLKPYRSCERMMPLMSAVEIRSETSKVVFESKFSRWLLFKGTGQEAKDIISRFPGENIVCLDGCQYRADGEINLSFDCSSRDSYDSAGKMKLSLGWSSQFTSFDNARVSILQQDVVSIVSEIKSIKSIVANEMAALEIMEAEWHDLEVSIRDHITAVDLVKESFIKHPICPVANIEACVEEQLYYSSLKEKAGVVTSELLKMFGDQMYQGRKIFDLIVAAAPLRSEIGAARSSIRIIEAGIIASEKLFSQFRAEEDSLLTDCEVLQCWVDQYSAPHRELRENQCMALEDIVACAAVCAHSRDSLELLNVALSQANDVIFCINRKYKKITHKISRYQDFLCNAETMRSSTNALKIAAEAEIQRLQSICTSLITPTCSVEIESVGENEMDEYLLDLEHQSNYLADREKSLDISILETVQILNEKMGTLTKSRAENQLRIKRLHCEILDATAMRYKILSSALSKTNDCIGSVYQQLIESGECYLSYPSDSSSLFEEGILLIARSEGRCWTEINKLSGGQQAACGLALLISFQDVFPSPVYLLDEVDAALDTRTAYKMGQLLKMRSKENKTQFIAVSHHPEFQVAASRIIGVYHVGGVATSVSASFC